MKSKYIIITITSILMFITCYKAIGITSSASSYITSDNSITTSKPYNSPVPSLLPVPSQSNDSNTDNTSNVVSSIKPTKKTDIGSVNNTVSPTQNNKTTNNNNNNNNKISPTKKASTSPNVPIKIPKIYTPQLSNKVTYENNNKTTKIDASNCNKGYIGIKYSGKNNKVKVQIKKDSQTYNYDLPSNNEYVIYPLQLGNGNYSINVLENISGTQYSSILNKTIQVKMNNSNYVFLYPNQYVWFTQNSDVVKRSASICNGYKKSIDKISAIFKYITTNISYDYEKAKTVQSGYLPNVDEILKTRKGICFDYASIMAAMCRAQGIPTKLITGYVSPNGVYHAWNEVYTQEKGWITVSFYLNKVGYNIVDPTFYSNMDNNDEAAKYIGNGSNYKKYHIY